MGKPKAPIPLTAYPPAWATSPREGHCCRQDERRDSHWGGGLRGLRGPWHERHRWRRQGRQGDGNDGPLVIREGGVNGRVPSAAGWVTCGASDWGASGREVRGCVTHDAGQPAQRTGPARLSWARMRSAVGTPRLTAAAWGAKVAIVGVIWEDVEGWRYNPWHVDGGEARKRR